MVNQVKPGSSNVVSLVPPTPDQFGLLGDESRYMSLVLEAFENHLRGTRALKDSSTKLAMGQIRRFAGFVQKPIWQWSQMDFDSFMGSKKRVRPLSAATQAGYLSYLRMLQEWLHANSELRALIEAKFSADVQEWVSYETAIPLRGKNKKRASETCSLNPDEVKALLNAFDSEIEKAFRSGCKAAF